jgi:S-adenosylmethionine:diacylglycerol 3-amino-3-carboxypropyl transferase
MQQKKFSGLNYSCGNEDYRIDSMLLPHHCKTIMSVAATGGQIIPFLAKQPSELSLVDMSEEQLVISELRFKTLLLLNYQEFLKFWDYINTQENLVIFRKEIISRIHMTTSTRKLMLTKLMESCNYASPLYLGKWDRRARDLSKIYRKILGKKILEIFTCKSIFEQENFLKEKFLASRIKLLVYFVASIATLYSTLRQSQVPARTSYFVFFKEYQRIFDSLFTKTLAGENFFLQLIILGKILYKKALPLEAQENIFIKAKKWASQCRVEFIHDDIISATLKSKSNINFLDLSNVNSYFEYDLKNNYLQHLIPNLAKGCLVLTRNFLSEPNNLNLDNFEDISEDFAFLFSQECTQIYTMSLYKKL